MNQLIDKTILFFICSVLLVLNHPSEKAVIPLLTALSISAAVSYVEKRKFTIFLFIGFIFIGIDNNLYLFFVPLLCYDFLSKKMDFSWILVLVPFIVHFNQSSQGVVILLFLFVILTVCLKHRTTSIENLREQYLHLRDETKESFIEIELKNKEVLANQDYELHVATLSERNRIARDIHDNVGHLLSRSLLQVGALHATSKDEEMKKDLKNIKETLSSAMDSIRSSVHDLHEQSLDAQTEIQKLIHSFSFCEIHFDYDVSSQLDQNLKYCFIAIAKESLVNIMKHSNATAANIVIREHPSFYQMIVHDNGTRQSNKDEKGIGLKNIRDRVMALKGNIHISDDHGFRIFITIQKGEGK